MPIDILKMFEDVIPNTGAQDRQAGLDRAGGIGQLGHTAALLQPANARTIRRSAGNLLGIDTRTQGEQLEQTLQSSDFSTPEARTASLARIGQIDQTAALKIKTMLAEQDRAQQDADARTAMAEAQKSTASRLAATPSAPEAKIARLRAILERKYEISTQQANDWATGVTDGTIQLENLEDGSAQLTDKLAALTGSEGGVIRLQPRRQAAQGSPAVPNEPETTLELPDGMSLSEAAEQGTGLWNVTSEFFGRVMSNISPAFLNEEKTEARQTLQIAENALIRSLALNRRFPEGEQLRIKRNLKITPSTIESPAAMQINLAAADKFLESEEVKLQRSIADVTTAPAQVVEDRASLRDIQAFRGLIFPTVLPASSLTDAASVESMSNSAVRRFIEETPDDVLDSLDPSIIEALSRRIR